MFEEAAHAGTASTTMGAITCHHVFGAMSPAYVITSAIGFALAPVLKPPATSVTAAFACMFFVV
jgi:hypothetical protein